MNGYIAKLPERVRLAIYITIVVALFCVGGFLVGLFIAIDKSKPLSQMPLYFWVFTLLAFIVGVFGSKRAHHPDMSISSALLRIGLASIGLGGWFLNGRMDGTGVFLLALLLPWGIRGAWFLIRTWRLQNNRATHT